MFSIIAGTILGALSFLLLVPSSHSVQTMLIGVGCIWAGSALGLAVSLFIGRSIKMIEREKPGRRLQAFRDEERNTRGLIARLHDDFIVRAFADQGTYDEVFIPVALTEIIADENLEATAIIADVVAVYDTSCWQYKWGRPSEPEGALVRYRIHVPVGTEPFNLRG